MSVAPSSALLRYLAALCDAVLERDAEQVRTLLARPLASHLPREVREEAIAQTRLGRQNLRAPIHLLEFSHRMTELLGMPSGAGGGQLELPLRVDVAAISARARRPARVAAAQADDEDEAPG